EVAGGLPPDVHAASVRVERPVVSARAGVDVVLNRVVNVEHELPGAAAEVRCVVLRRSRNRQPQQGQGCGDEYFHPTTTRVPTRKLGLGGRNFLPCRTTRSGRRGPSSQHASDGWPKRSTAARRSSTSERRSSSRSPGSSRRARRTSTRRRRTSTRGRSGSRRPK